MPGSPQPASKTSTQSRRIAKERPQSRSNSVSTNIDKHSQATANQGATPPSSIKKTTNVKKVPKKVKISNESTNTTVEVPCDQENPLDVWNVYSPIVYVKKREQRRLQKVRSIRAEEVRKCFKGLYEMMDTSSSKTSRENLTDEELDKVGFTRNNVACVAFIMSLWPTLPVSKRPKMTVPVQRAIDALFQGTQVCVFNESPHSPVQCLAALRLLRNYDADEGSIAIFNSSKPDVIDGYIPLAFLHSVSRGLEEVEKSKYETPSGTVSSTLLPQGTKVNVECKRALSLHCRAPQKFYVTFIVLNDHEYHNWRRVLDYFVLLNTAAANHSVKRQK